MKQGIHPEYKSATIVCSCGNEIETRSTQEEIHVEICSVCHPFYTGRQKLVDTAGRVERFKRKYGDTSSGQTGEDEEPGDGAGETEEGAPKAAAEEDAPAAASPDEAQESEGPARPRKMGAGAADPEGPEPEAEADTGDASTGEE